MLINNENAPAKERVLMSAAFDFETLFAMGLPVPQPKWTDFPKYNSIGGQNDPESIPVERFVEATARVLRRRGQTIATYNQDCGPLGDIEILKCASFLPEDLQSIAGCQPRPNTFS